MEYILIALVVSCVITILMEFIPSLFMKNKIQWIKTSVLCNIITNPILNLVSFLLYGSHLPVAMILIFPLVGEIIVFVFEAYIYKKVLNKPAKVCLTYSTVANLLSLVIGSCIWISVCYPIFESIAPRSNVLYDIALAY